MKKAGFVAAIAVLIAAMVGGVAPSAGLTPPITP
jgi:hypothetical protein